MKLTKTFTGMFLRSLLSKVSPSFLFSFCFTFSFCFCFCVTGVRAQYTRGFISDGKAGANAPRHIEMGNRNFVFQDIYQQDLDTGYVRLTEFDPEGNIVETRKLKSFVKNQSKLLGLFRRGTDRVVYVYSVGSGIASQWYMGSVNINTWSHVDQQIVIPNLVSNFSEFMEVGDSLVTLIVTNSNLLTRLCFSKNDPQDYTLFTMDTLSSFNANLRIGLTKDVYLNQFFILKDNKTIYRYNVNGVVKKQFNYLDVINHRRMFVYDFNILLADRNGIHVFTRELDSVTTVNYAYPNNFNTADAIDMTSYAGWLFVTQIGRTDRNYITRFDKQFNLLEQGAYEHMKSQSLSVNSQGPFITGITNKMNTDLYDFEGNNSTDVQLVSTLAFNFPSIDQMKRREDFSIRMDLKDDYSVFVGDGLNAVFYNDALVYRPEGYGLMINDTMRILAFNMANGLLGVKSNNQIGGFYGLYSNQYARMGPYTNRSDYDEMVNAKYSRFYYVDRTLIEQHAWEQNYPNPSYQMPHGIKHWPAHGDVSKGQAANLAPFHDINGNGSYEPELGEYPKMYGDRCFLKIVHYPDYEQQDTPIDVLMYIFSFDCDTSEELRNTVFYRTEFISRGGELDSVYFVEHTDFDIGNPLDDFAGTDVMNNMVYGYNGDTLDEPYVNGAFLVNQGWGEAVPAAGMILLQGMKKKANGIDEDFGVGAGESVNGLGFQDEVIDNEFWGLTSSRYYVNAAGPNYDPSTPIQYYNVANGLTSAGDTTKVNDVAVRHAFFGNSDPLFYSSAGVDHGNAWVDDSTTTGPNWSDRRQSGASGPGYLGPTDTIVILQALTSAVDTVNVSPEASVVKLQEKAAELLNYFKQNQTPCSSNFDPIRGDLSVTKIEVEELEMEVYPNPNQGSFALNTPLQIVGVSATDASGRAIPLARLNHGYTLPKSAKGIYFIHIETSKGNTTKKIIVQ
ncbi:MAG: T9SS type A sorting domain-containing protein [Crocinitomicaceae bacterium]|nr:T9SS type A sorting domain-containing protein [Crocinitomicaceae bacterium]